MVEQVATGPAPAAKRERWWAVQPARTDTEPITTKRAYAEVLGVFAAFFAASILAAAFSLGNRTPSANPDGWSAALPSALDQLTTTGLCLALPILLVARRGPRPPKLGLRWEGAGSGQVVRIWAWGLLAFLAGGLVTSALETGSYDLGKFSYADLVVNVAHAIQAGPIEEVVVLAFVVTTLEQARRPRPEIVAVALLLRCSYHIYYGPGVVGILVWASVFLWLYLRFRTILPLIILHSTWDTVIFLGDHWHGVLGTAYLGYFGIVVAAPITWLVARGNAKRKPPTGSLWWQQPGPGGSPGWNGPPPGAWGPPPPGAWGPPGGPPVPAPGPGSWGQAAPPDRG